MESTCKRMNTYVRQDSWSPRRKVFLQISREQIEESARKKSVITECLSVLTHSRTCEDEACLSKRCASMKNVWKHFNACPKNKQLNANCPICNSVTSLLQYHANDCQNDSCTVTRCQELKDGFLKWQKSQQSFLSSLVKFRLSTIPTVVKNKSKQTNTTNSPAVAIKDLPNEPVKINL